MPILGKEEFSINKKSRTRKVSRTKKLRRKIAVKSRKSFVLMSFWLLITTAFTIAWYTLGGTAWLVASLLGGLASVASAFATFNPETVETGPRSQPKSTGNPRGKAPSNRSGKRSPQSPRKPRKCSVRCRNSTKPITDCDCSCKGRSHGANNRDA